MSLAIEFFFGALFFVVGCAACVAGLVLIGVGVYGAAHLIVTAGCAL